VDQNYLINLVSGLFGSKKQLETGSSLTRAYLAEPSRLTGVARYLKSQEVLPVLSGVSRYLKNMEEMSAANEVA